MPYIPPSVVQEVKRMDLLTYLKNYEPYELVHFSGNRTLRVERQLGKKPNSKAEDCAPKMLTKQEIKTKTPAGVRELPIPD